MWIIVWCVILAFQKKCLSFQILFLIDYNTCTDNKHLLTGCWVSLLYCLFSVEFRNFLCSEKRIGYGAQSGPMRERFRPMPLCSPVLLPTAHALVILNSIVFVYLWLHQSYKHFFCYLNSRFRVLLTCRKHYVRKGKYIEVQIEKVFHWDIMKLPFTSYILLTGTAADLAMWSKAFMV